MVSSVAFSPDGKMLASGSFDQTAKLWNVAGGSELHTLKSDSGYVISVAFSPDGKTLASADTTVKLWDVASGKNLASLISLDYNDWAVATPEGRFDTNKDLDNIVGIHWVLSDDPFTPKPLELFMRQYYEPGLLPRLLNCNKEGNCNKEFKPLPPIGQVNRVQPRVGKPLTSPRPEK